MSCYNQRWPLEIRSGARIIDSYLPITYVPIKRSAANYVGPADSTHYLYAQWISLSATVHLYQYVAASTRMEHVHYMAMVALGQLKRRLIRQRH